ncbi:low molecular weight protein arginine phosphatase [candidate division KSB1 bacterium]|nr:low molecular weight protein arginine phosphatase [candidate division KSB1 bacterium]
MTSAKRNKNIFIINFVCSGNSCRSPMAEGLLKKMLYDKYKDKVKIHSSGTLGINNNPATLNAIAVAQEKGIDISSHRSKGLTLEQMAEADLIFALAENHFEYMLTYFPEYQENVFLLKSFATGSDRPFRLSIDDPIGQSMRVYRRVINEIEKELIRIQPFLEQLIDGKLCL